MFKKLKYGKTNIKSFGEGDNIGFYFFDFNNFINYINIYVFKNKHRNK